MRETLLTRAEAMGLAMTREQAERFQTYHARLTEANAHFNLTRVPDDIVEAIDRNYLDSAAPLVKGLPEGVATLADVGSGAGFPGVPLSILRPDIRVTLFDSLGKRVDFLNAICTELGLNAAAVHLRAEDAARSAAYREAFDLTTARAVAPLNLLCEYLLPLTRVGGQMLAYKGPGFREELDQAENALRLLGGQIDRCEDAPIPGRDWSHTLVYLKKTAPTPEKYPRRAGKPEKSPL